MARHESDVNLYEAFLPPELSIAFEQMFEGLAPLAECTKIENEFDASDA